MNTSGHSTSLAIPIYTVLAVNNVPWYKSFCHAWRDNCKVVFKVGICEHRLEPSSPRSNGRSKYQTMRTAVGSHLQTRLEPEEIPFLLQVDRTVIGIALDGLIEDEDVPMHLSVRNPNPPFASRVFPPVN